MLRLLATLTLLFFNLQATCEGGYDSCIQKIIDSKSIQNQIIQIPVTQNQRLVFSTSLPSSFKVIKSDPFLSLYLVEDKNCFKYPFAINNHLALGQASVNDKSAVEVKITKNQIGLNKFAGFDEALFVPAILTNSCCNLEGIVTTQGIIQKEYLQRFMQTKNSDYSDIGIRVKDEAGFVIVTASDPFMEDNKFQKDDCILEYDGKKVKEASLFMKDVLFSKIGSSHRATIKRNSKILKFELKTQKRYGGGYISDTFLEQKGIYFDKDLHITKLEQNFKNYGLLLGDKLLQVNGKKVQNEQDLIEYISNFKDFSTLLFEREHFQFFVQIN